MTQQKKDNELSWWIILGALFTLVLIAVDIWYSSIGSMSVPFKLIAIIGHSILLALWVNTVVKFNDPNYDYLQKGLLWCSVLLILFIGIHHATSVEDKQILIDSHENAIKDSAK